MSEVRNRPEEQRFELAADGETAIAAYRRDGDILTFTHTAVPDALAGRGIATQLIGGALAQVRAQGLRIVPECAFVRHYVDTHADVQDLVAR